MNNPQQENENPSPKKLLNPDGLPLTKEKYQELSGLRDLSDEDAEQAAQDIQLLAKILYQIIHQKKHI